ncbi:MAG: hypothetical protein QOD98_1196 [Nocardioidaceae bacterium]|nr:hypothetical protein [Nocardioidaceae bacterium]
METEAPGRMWTSRLAAFLACVVLPLATFSVWLDQRVTETDGYVDAVGPLAENPTVQREVAARLEAAVLAALPLDRLPDNARENAALAVHTVVLAILTSSAFPPAWRDANRTAHTQLIRALSGKPGAVGPDGQVRVNLAAIVDTVLAELKARGLFEGEVDVQASFAVLDADQLDRAQRGYRLLNALGLWLPVAWLVLVGLALLLSPRRGRTVGTLAIGSVVAMAVLLGSLALGRGVVVDQVPSADRKIAGPVWDVVTSSLHTAVLVLMAVAGALVLLRIATRLAGRGR